MHEISQVVREIARNRYNDEFENRTDALTTAPTPTKLLITFYEMIYEMRRDVVFEF